MKKTFNQTGTFEAYTAAEQWLIDNGYTYGSMQGRDPIGILKGDIYISKWRNIPAHGRKNLDGIITGVDKRNGPVTVEIFEGDEG